MFAYILDGFVDNDRYYYRNNHAYNEYIGDYNDEGNWMLFGLFPGFIGLILGLILMVTVCLFCMALSFFIGIMTRDQYQKDKNKYKDIVDSIDEDQV